LGGAQRRPTDSFGTTRAPLSGRASNDEQPAANFDAVQIFIGGRVLSNGTIKALRDRLTSEFTGAARLYRVASGGMMG
jgi:hypothetical protein